MHVNAHHLNSCNAFWESREAKIENLARLVLVRGNCVDPDDHAPGVVNDIYIKVRQSWDTLRSPERVIYIITKNTASTHAAGCRREAPAEFDDDAIPLFPSHALDPTAMLERIILLEELIAKLKDKLDEDIFDLRLQGFTYDEMAVILEKDSDTLRSRYARAVQRLKPIISPSAPSHIRNQIIAHND